MYYEKLIFAVYITFSSIILTSSLLSILKAMNDMNENAGNFSFITILFARMWDIAILGVCFNILFED